MKIKWGLWAWRLIAFNLIAVTTIWCLGTAAEAKSPQWFGWFVALPVDALIFCVYKAMAEDYDD